MRLPTRVAVVMPFKNSAGTIVNSVSSVLNQTDMRGCSITLLCVNDGSTDDSLDLINSVKQEVTRSIVVIDGPGKGPAHARNCALDYIRAAGDEYTHVAFCDSDDVWYSWHLNRSLTYLTAYAVDLMYSDVDCENEKGEKLVITGIPNPAVFDRDLLRRGNYIFISSVVMNASVISTGNFDPDAVPMEDWDYWLRVSEKYKIRHMHKPGAGIVYMWKSTGSYYTAEDSEAAKQRIQRKMNIKDPMSVEGWLSKAEGEFLAANAVGRKCIEIGSYKGKSTCFIAEKAASVVCIDTFKADNGGQTQMQSPTTYVDFARNTGHFSNITPLIGMSQDVHPLLKNDEFDFIFIDGMHDFESVMNDVKNYLSKLKDGAIIMFHDYFERDWPGVVMCVNLLFGGPDELVDTVAKVTLTADRRFELAIKFAGMSAANTLKGPDLKPVEGLEIPEIIDSLELKADTTGFEKGSLSGKKIVITPWAAKMPDRENAKNFPHWPEVVSMLRSLGAHTIQVGLAGEKFIGCDEMVLNPTQDHLNQLLAECDTFVSVDSFFPHFAAYHNKKGVVIFSKSDPKIFGHSIHLNLLKSREYLRPDQFRWWRDVDLDKAAFVAPNEVVAGVLEILKDTEIYNELSEKS